MKTTLLTEVTVGEICEGFGGVRVRLDCHSKLPQ